MGSRPPRRHSLEMVNYLQVCLPQVEVMMKGKCLQDRQFVDKGVSCEAPRELTELDRHCFLTESGSFETLSQSHCPCSGGARCSSLVLTSSSMLSSCGKRYAASSTIQTPKLCHPSRVIQWIQAIVNQTSSCSCLHRCLCKSSQCNCTKRLPQRKQQEIRN